jgi:hypothetical protein
METKEVIDDGAKNGATLNKLDGRRTPQKHGLTGMIKGRYKAHARHLDGRSALAQAMNSYRAELLASLEGAELLSAQELTLVEMCAKALARPNCTGLFNVVRH